MRNKKRIHLTALDFLLRNVRHGERKETDPIFCENAIADITDFDADEDDHSIGYVCKCDVSVFTNGDIQIRSISGDTEERFSVLSIILLEDDCYVRNTAEVHLITEDKDIRLAFQTVGQRKRLMNIIKELLPQLSEKK